MLVGGHDVKQLQMTSLRHAMASVPQDMVLFNDTIYYNIAYGNLDATREAVESAARAAQVSLWCYSCSAHLGCFGRLSSHMFQAVSKDALLLCSNF